MKYSWLLLMLFFAETTIAQSGIPYFLEGTWKMENKAIYEHWDKLNENTLKGFSYELKNGEMLVSEYLEISKDKNGISYTTFPLNQNQGKGINFKLTKKGNTYIFENSKHDFPNKIGYQQLSDTEIFIQVTGRKEKGFSYKMIKQNVQSTKKDTVLGNPNYDAALANKLGADDYGMKTFLFVILKTGSNKTEDKQFIAEVFRGHLNNINRLVKEEKIIVAGPFGENDKNYRGLFILNNVESKEEAEKLLQSDPAIKNGLLDVEIIEWYGSAALPEYLLFSNKIWKSKP